MNKVQNYSLDIISEEEANIIVGRMLKMVHDKDAMFTCITDHIISDLVFQDYINIDLENETMEGTTLTEKGMLRLSKYLNQ